MLFHPGFGRRGFSVGVMKVSSGFLSLASGFFTRLYRYMFSDFLSGASGCSSDFQMRLQKAPQVCTHRKSEGSVCALTSIRSCGQILVPSLPKLLRKQQLTPAVIFSRIARVYSFILNPRCTRRPYTPNNGGGMPSAAPARSKASTTNFCL